MEAKHTPGPLEVRIAGTCSGAWAEIVQRCIDPATNEVWFRGLAKTEATHVERTDPSGQPIEGIVGTIIEMPERFEPTEDSEELIANAHLWANAAELLEALDGLLKELHSPSKAVHRHTVWTKRAYAAIAKAQPQEGEEA